MLFRGRLLRRAALAGEFGLSVDAHLSDLVVAAYERWGENLGLYLQGWLSFVLWDQIRHRLIAVGDSLGHHPLYFTIDARVLAISFDIDSLVSETAPSLAVASVAAHVCGFTEEVGTTFFEQIRALPAGARLIVERDRETLITARHGPRRTKPQSEVAASCELLETLHQVVDDLSEGSKLVGITLSSGLDSTTLAAVLASVRPESRRLAISWSARSVPDADEFGPATRVARSLGMEVVEVAADCHAPLSAPEGIWPGLGSPSVNIYREVWQETFRQARELGIDVLFTGQGGDLGFGAVFPFSDLFLSGRWLRLVREVRAYRRRVEVHLPWLIRYRILGQAARWAWPLRQANPPRWLGPALRGLVPKLSKEDRWALPGDRERRRFLRSPRRMAATAMLTAEAREFGIDICHPWIDPRLTALAESLPASWTFVDGLTKAPVRRAMRGRLPAETLDRPTKIYPDGILRCALRGPNRIKIEPLLTDMISADLGFVEPLELRRAIDEYASGRGSGIFWYSLTLEAWLRRLKQRQAR